MINQEVEKAYNDLIEYEKEVNNFLLNITGYHSKYDIEELIKTNKIKNEINRLYKNIYYATRIEHLLFNEENCVWIFSNGKKYTSKELIEKRKSITRNIRYRLDAALFFSQEMMNSK